MSSISGYTRDLSTLSDEDWEAWLTLSEMSTEEFSELCYRNPIEVRQRINALFRNVLLDLDDKMHDLTGSDISEANCVIASLKNK